MITDSIVDAMDTLIDLCTDESQKLGMEAMREMLCDWSEEIWDPSSERERKEWLEPYLRCQDSNVDCSNQSENMQTVAWDLVIFCFETGDASCPYWQELALVDHNSFDYATLEDSISSYMDSDASEDKEYEYMAEDLMNASGWTWCEFSPEQKINEVHTYWI